MGAIGDALERPPAPAVPVDDFRYPRDHGVDLARLRAYRLRRPKAFRGYPVALRPTLQDGIWQVFFMTHKIAQVDLRQTEDHHQCVNHVP